MRDQAYYDEIATALEGRTVLETPRVSRETIIDVLKQQNSLLRDLQTEVSTLRDGVMELRTSHSDMAASLSEVERRVSGHDKDLEKLCSRTDQLESEVSVANEKLQTVDVLQRRVDEQQTFLERLDQNFREHKKTASKFIASAGAELEKHGNELRDLSDSIENVQDQVSSFTNNVVLSSNQITVEQETGFVRQAVNLTQLLSMLHDMMENLKTSASKNDGRLNDHEASLQEKASISVEPDVEQLKDNVMKIQHHIQNDDKEELQELRASHEVLSDTVEVIQGEVGNKCDRENVEKLIDSKYEDIVDYLQRALRNSEDDEQAFRGTTEDLLRMLESLQALKADKSELTALREAVVKSEALVNKLANGGRMRVKSSEGQAGTGVGDDGANDAVVHNARGAQHLRRGGPGAVDGAEQENDMFGDAARRLHDEDDDGMGIVPREELLHLLDNKVDRYVFEAHLSEVVKQLRQDIARLRAGNGSTFTGAGGGGGIPMDDSDLASVPAGYADLAMAHGYSNQRLAPVSVPTAFASTGDGDGGGTLPNNNSRIGARTGGIPPDYLSQSDAGTNHNFMQQQIRGNGPLSPTWGSQYSLTPSVKRLPTPDRSNLAGQSAIVGRPATAGASMAAPQQSNHERNAAADKLPDLVAGAATEKFVMGSDGHLYVASSSAAKGSGAEATMARLEATGLASPADMAVRPATTGSSPGMDRAGRARNGPDILTVEVPDSANAQAKDSIGRPAKTGTRPTAKSQDIDGLNPTDATETIEERPSGVGEVK